MYISVDIDVLDPAFAPGKVARPPKPSPPLLSQNFRHALTFFCLFLLLATGTPEAGGWSSRELLTILDGLEGLPLVGADVVEVAPVYDTVGETTTLAAAEVAYQLIELMVATPVKADVA